MILELDQDTHKYTVDGREVRSVTQILQGVGIIEVWKYRKSGTQRGSEIHECLALIDKGIVKSDVFVDTGHYGYMAAYEIFKKQTEFQVGAVEQNLYSKTYNIAGTPDRVGSLKGSECILDFKTGQKEEWHAVQLCMYEMLIDKPCKKYALYLRDDSTWRLLDVARDYKNGESHYRNIATAAIAINSFKGG